MSKPSPKFRSDLMREIAALHVKCDRTPKVAQRLELQKKIAELTKRVFAK